jgi:hypothetical protein
MASAVLLYKPNLAIHRTWPIEMLYPYTHSSCVYTKLQSVNFGYRYHGRGCHMGPDGSGSICGCMFSQNYRTESRQRTLY